MVMKIEPVVSAIEAAVAALPQAWRVLLSPRGRPFTQPVAQELARRPSLVMVCGHYEGIDERVRVWVDEEVSVGDYVLAGGEAAALVMLDAISRLVPGFVGNPGSLAQESFEEGLLEYPQYTRPEAFRGVRVPEVLLSGDHAAIARWRRQQALRLTRERRPDLLAKAKLTEEDRRILEDLKNEK
jgi:tRNA (guanine37-N1)-methyltransferase